MRDSVTIYVDASFRAFDAGYGFVASLGDRLLVASRKIEGTVRSSNMAEAIGVEQALLECIAEMPFARHIAVVSDCSCFVDTANGLKTCWETQDLADRVNELRRPSRSLAVIWTKGHTSGTQAAIANGIAHKLAYLGRHRECLTYRAGFDEDWYESIKSADDRLDHYPPMPRLTADEAAKTLRLPKETVLELLRHGHLALTGEGDAITKRSVDAVLLAMADLRTSMRSMAMAG